MENTSRIHIFFEKLDIIAIKYWKSTTAPTKKFVPSDNAYTIHAFSNHNSKKRAMASYHGPIKGFPFTRQGIIALNECI